MNKINLESMRRKKNLYDLRLNETCDEMTFKIMNLQEVTVEIREMIHYVNVTPKYSFNNYFEEVYNDDTYMLEFTMFLGEPKMTTSNENPTFPTAIDAVQECGAADVEVLEYFYLGDNVHEVIAMSDNNVYKYTVCVRKEVK